jgi:oligopeptide/dipeptide ABC transporter ATP-binding protein
MYLGKIVEIGPASEVFHHPLHPYSKALISAIPIPDPRREAARARIILPGDPPSPLHPPPGCAFHPRCPYAIDKCRQIVPPLEAAVEPGREAACIRVKEINV